MESTTQVPDEQNRSTIVETEYMDSGNVNRKVRVDITWKCGSGRLLYQHAREYVREKGLRIPMVLPIRQELGLGLGETVDCIMGCAWDWVRRADELGLP